MFWDRVAWAYDIFADGINKKTHRALRAKVGALILPTDEVLECACGTGLLSGVIAEKCRHLVATDFSANMLKRARKKYKNVENIEFREGNILQLDFPDAQFDAVVAANVIHLLDEPYRALEEMCRVCRPGGRLIIPTYMNRTARGRTSAFAGALGKAGADFKREFTVDTYVKFFEDAGYPDVTCTLCEGKVPCAVAVLRR